MNIAQIQYNVMYAYGDDGEGYAHAYRVAKQATTNEEYAVALCHDLVEDNYATMDDLAEWGLSSVQRAAIRLLTREFGDQTYEEYIENILYRIGSSEGKLAARVKFYDLVDHLHPDRAAWFSKNPDRVYRYIDAMELIVQRFVEQKQDVNEL